MPRAVVMSPDAMGGFKKLPLGIFEQIIKELCGIKYNDFDSIGLKDLQNIRLVSTAFCEITSPILFENVIWDLKFLRHKDVRRIIEFARNYPHLAKFVKRLQLRVPPTITAVNMEELYEHTEFLESIGTSTIDVTRYQELMIVPFRQWKTLAEDAFMSSPSDLEQLYQRSFQLLPKLEHIETATSTYYYEYLAMSSLRLLMETGIIIEDYDSYASYAGEFRNEPLLSKAQSLADAFAVIISTAHLRVKSFKFRQVPLMEDLPDRLLPTRLQHLDLEFMIPPDYRKAGDGQRLLRLAATQWHQQLKSLCMLRTLRLSLVGSWEDVNELASQEDYAFYIDDLLPSCAPDNHKTSGGFTFLTDLTLSNLLIRPLGLRNFVLKHRATLQKLTLHRVSLYVGTDIDWIHVISALSHLHNLSVLELWKIGTHYNSWVDEEGEEVEVVNDEQARGLFRAVIQRILAAKELRHLHDIAGGKVEEAMSWEMEEEVEGEMEAEMEAEMEGEVEGEIEGEVEGEMEAEMEAELEAEVLAELEAEMEAEMEVEMAAELEGKMVREMTREPVEETEDDFEFF